MPRKTKKLPKSDKLKPFLCGLTIGLTVIVVSLMVITRGQQRVGQLPDESYVSLGSMEYDFSSGKAVKRTDETVKGLRQFLTQKASKETSDNCSPYYTVVAVSKDEKQVLLGYGCSDLSGRMFAVNDDSAWRTISPTNHFDIFSVPECRYVDDNKIDKAIAPVCVNGLNEPGPDTYSVR